MTQPVLPLTSVGETALPSARRFYLPELDGLRFVAFLLVLVHHQAPVDLAFISVPAIRNLLSRLVTFGWVGVDLFFCLSAFLITSLLLREQSVTGSVSLKKFYIRRTLRIWPLYFLCLILAFLVFPLFRFNTPAFGSAEYYVLIRQHLFPYALFLGNFSYAHFPSSLTFAIAPLWSISVEEQFYLIWPLMLYFLSKASRRTFWLVLVGLLGLSIISRSYIMLNAIPYPWVWTNTLGRLDPLILGTGVGLLYTRSKTIMPAWISIAIAAALYGAVSSFPQVGASNHTIWQLLAVAFASAMLLIGILDGRFSRIILGNSVLRWAGKLSYGFYVFHLTAMIIVATLILPRITTPVPAIRLLLRLGLSLGITVVIAAISYYAFERWFLLLKERFTVVRSRGVS